MATAIEDLRYPAFGSWLAEMSQKAGVSAPQFHRALIRMGGSVSDQTVYNWLSEKSEPGVSHLMLILATLEQLLPEVDVWAEFKNFYMSYSRGTRKRVRRSRPIQPPLMAAVSP